MKTIFDHLADGIAGDIFECGNGPFGKCERIQFMTGDWKIEEKGQGGLCESALAKVISESLAKQLTKTIKLINIQP